MKALNIVGFICIFVGFLGLVFLLSLTWAFGAWYTVHRIVWLMIMAFTGIFMAGMVVWLRNWFAVTRGITPTLRTASALFLVLGFIWMLKVHYLSLTLIMFAFVGAEFGLTPSASAFAFPILCLSFTPVYFFASLKLNEAEGRNIAFYVALCLLGMPIGILESQFLSIWPSITWLGAVYVGVNMAALALIGSEIRKGFYLLRWQTRRANSTVALFQILKEDRRPICHCRKLSMTSTSSSFVA